MSNNLTGWRTITEIRNALDLPERSLRKMASSARRKQEGWVQLERLEGVPYVRWLINTDSQFFHQYIQQQQENLKWAPNDSQEVEIIVPCREAWPELCDWLIEQGVCIFYNELEEDSPWQWQWGELSGSGCDSEESAILAAIKAKVARAELVPDLDLLMGTLPPYVPPSPIATKRRRWRFL